MTLRALGFLLAILSAGATISCSGGRPRSPAPSPPPPPHSASKRAPAPTPASVLVAEAPDAASPSPSSAVEPAEVSILPNASASPRIGESPPPARPDPSPSPRSVFTPPSGKTIELGGIVYSETDPVALLNGRAFRVGEYIEGYEVVFIGPTRVELARGEERIALRLE